MGAQVCFCPSVLIMAFTRDVIFHIGTFVPRNELPQLASVGRKFGVACADARFWERLWYVEPRAFHRRSSVPVQRGHSLAACIRHAEHARSFRLEVGRLRREKVSEECKTVLSGLAAGLSSGQLHELTITGNLGICAEPIFGTAYELERHKTEEDVLKILSTMCVPGRCQLRRLSLNMGSFSVGSFQTLLQILRPPLWSLVCREALVTGWTFERVIAVVRDAHPCPDVFQHFESDEYIVGEDPLGLLASAFPNLRTLKVPRLHNTQPERVERFRRLGKVTCGNSREALYGAFRIQDAGDISWFITSNKHDDNYRGQGLSWAEFDNTSECMFCWDVGDGVTREQVLSFMTKCGIRYQANLEPDPD